MKVYVLIVMLSLSSFFSFSTFFGDAGVTGMKLHSLEFIPYKDQSNLLLESDGNSSIASFVIRGQTANQSAGFSTFVGRNIDHALITIGAVNKTSLNESRGEGQISFVFHLDGQRSDYKLVLVNGRLASWGWTNDTYFLGANSSSVNFLDFSTILGDHGDNIRSLRSIVIGVDRFLKLDPLEFRIDLFNSTMAYPFFDSSINYPPESPMYE